MIKLRKSLKKHSEINNVIHFVKIDFRKLNWVKRFREISKPFLIFYKLKGENLSRYLWAVRPSPQNSAKAKKVGEGATARKS
ncbi:hypothetical protein, partial [Bacillus pseudomycoides]|uniref:hypothetical protein n=1 Tax=Bacillus pseudomycoides TaxID=64104 RepID=UPI001155AF2F